MSELAGRKTGKVKSGIIFLHVPKTGGTSISKALRRHYRFSNEHIKSEASARAALSGLEDYAGISDHADRVQALRLSLVLYWAQTGKRFLTGHVWNDRKLVRLKENGYSIVTCLRNPVSRWFSAYFYDRYKSGDHARISQDIEDFLSTERARGMGNTYVRYIGGLREDGDYSSEKGVRDALEMLETIDILGTLENLDQFRARVRDQLGISLKVPHRRRSPAESSEINRIKSSQIYRRRVEDLCAPDIELYERASSLVRQG